LKYNNYDEARKYTVFYSHTLVNYILTQILKFACSIALLFERTYSGVSDEYVNKSDPFLFRNIKEYFGLIRNIRKNLLNNIRGAFLIIHFLHSYVYKAFIVFCVENF